MREIDSQELKNITCHLSNGLTYLPREYDCCCILGMGGSTIFDILNEKKESLSQFETIIIEPQSMPSKPISFLLNNGFYNDAGQYVYEKRYYPLLRFKKGYVKTNELEEEFGPYPVKQKDDHLKEMFIYQIKQLEPYLDNIETKKKYDVLIDKMRKIFDEA